MEDYFVAVPSISWKATDHMTINAGAVINIADQVEPKETIQYALGVTFTGKMSFIIDTDGDGVKDNKDMEIKTPAGYPIDTRGVSLDTDKDGVPDGRDLQLLTPRGAKVDKNGVAKDTDGDGVYDGIDKEPNTPRYCEVDAYGVALDDDIDGVPNCLDKQLDTPEGCPVDKDGIALDDDADGVPNCKDLEADTPKGSKVDQHGRAIKQKELKKEEKSLIEQGVIRLNNVLFATGSAKIQTDSYPVLKEVAGILEKYPTLKIQIEGHTDNTGKREKNLKLSQDRAQSVLEFLLTMNPNLKRTQFVVLGFGPDKPISTNKTLEGRQMNRRVEFVVLNKEELKKIK